MTNLGFVKATNEFTNIEHFGCWLIELLLDQEEKLKFLS